MCSTDDLSCTFLQGVLYYEIHVFVQCNFWALLKFGMEASDFILSEHLDTAAQNATCTSPTIQNQLIDIISQIRQKNLNRVKRSGWFTVIADEVTDVSNKELLSLVLR